MKVIEAKRVRAHDRIRCPRDGQVETVVQVAQRIQARKVYIFIRTSRHDHPALRSDFQVEVIDQADENGNTVARDGVDRCFCGCKYWENDCCLDCGEHVDRVIQAP